MEKDFSNKKYNIAVNNINNSTSIQIQQGTVNSSQIQTLQSDFDYTKVLEILNEIGKYQSIFANTYGEHSQEVETALSTAIDATNSKEAPSKIKKLLTQLKDISLGVSNNLIATGILELLKKLGI